MWEDESAPEHQAYEPDWQMVPDGDGNMHMIDVNDKEDIEGSFNAAADVRFILFTVNNRNAGQTIAINNAGQLSASHYNAAWPTRFIIHGWNSNGGSQVNTAIRNAYLNRGSFNVIVVDWGAGAQTANYAAARDRINPVGLLVGQFCDFLNVHGMNFNSLTISGHSLGGHAAGIAGKRVTRGRVASIVALDPAFPLFSMGNPGARVDRGDANYVEIIHTDIGRLGFDQPIGHASFYPNWGRGMPGCGIDLVGTCGHSRAHEFFTQSIAANNGFWATQCAGWANIQNSNCPSVGPNRLMGGEPANQGANGVYFLVTRPNSPFASGPR